MKTIRSYAVFCFLGLACTSCVSPQKMSSSPERWPQANNQAIGHGVVTVDDPSVFSNVFVISDVHGMYQPVLAILKAGKVIDQKNNWMAGKSLLIVTGGSIDKGPQSLEILSLWIQLQSQSSAAGGGLIHVLGNHEAEFLADPQGDSKAATLLDELKAQNLPLTELTSMDTARGKFLHNEPVVARIGKWLFFHSGFLPDMSWSDLVTKSQQVTAKMDYGNDFLIGSDSLLKAKDWEKNSSTMKPVLDRMGQAGIFGTVFGHQPTAFGIKGRSAAKASGRLIKIDNGMPPEGGSHPGSLLVFTNPSLMSKMSYPPIKVILPDGSAQDLTPE